MERNNVSTEFSQLMLHVHHILRLNAAETLVVTQQHVDKKQWVLPVNYFIGPLYFIQLDPKLKDTLST